MVRNTQLSSRPDEEATQDIPTQRFFRQPNPFRAPNLRLKATGAANVPFAVVANAAPSGDSLDSGGEFDIQSLAVDKLLVAHSKNDSVLNKMYDAVDHWLEVLLESVIPGGLLNVTVDTKRDALGEFGYSGSSPRVSNWDMTRIWDEDHSGVYWSKDDGRLKSEPNQSEFWRPLSAKLRESGNACTA